MRISTQAVVQSALAELQRAQVAAFEAQTQVATGKVAQDIKGFGGTSETLATARSALSRAEAFELTATRLSGRLAAQDFAFEQISDAAADLREALTTVEGPAILQAVEDAFQTAKLGLNAQYGGTYLFGGVRTDAPPFTADTVANLQAAPAIADVFENADRRPTAQIEDGLTLETGFLASEIAQPLMESLERIADFDAGPNGPFASPPSPAQQAFIRAETQAVIAAFDQINGVRAQAGSIQARVEAAITNNRQRADDLQLFLSETEDVDLAEAAARLQQAQNTIDASARTFSILTQTSLLNFL